MDGMMRQTRQQPANDHVPLHQARDLTGEKILGM